MGLNPVAGCDRPFRISRSSTWPCPSAERLLKPSPQLIRLTLRKLSEVLFKLSFHFVPGAFKLKFVHGHLDISEAAIVRSNDPIPFLLSLPCQGDHGSDAD